MNTKVVIIGLFSLGWFSSCGNPSKPLNNQDNRKNFENIVMSEKLDTATFGSGCFWCTEAVFESLEGVVSATSGYMGGQVPNPTYKEICTGTTGHAEVVQVIYDPNKVSFELLLEAFWASHDPTTLNRQGNDVGTQYRSVIFYHNDQQQTIANEFKAVLISNGVFEKPIVTEITKAGVFYAAENYHQEYYELNGSEPYCQFVIRPKLDKFRKAFSDRLKKEKGD